jgi:hypothetical protein
VNNHDVLIGVILIVLGVMVAPALIAHDMRKGK